MHAFRDTHAVASGHRGEPAPVGGWEVAVERGPDWLFLRLERRDAVASGGALAERLLDVIRVNHAHRVVVECDRVDAVDDAILDAIAAVGSRVRDDGGLIRVCGLSANGVRRLQSSEQAGDIPHFESRSAAVGPRAGAIP